MQRRFIKGSYKPIFPVGLGCLQLTEFPPNATDPNREETFNLLKQAYHLGINLFDTADFYGSIFGENELFRESIFTLVCGRS